MSDIEFAIWFFVIFFIIITIMNTGIGGWWGWNWNTWWNKTSEDFSKHEKEKVKLYKKLEKANLAMENLLIKKEELENEIEKLDIESSMSFENENENNTKIRKLELQLKQVEIKISDMDESIYNINREIQWISMY